MERIPIWALLFLIFLVLPRSNSVVDNDTITALVQFMDKLLQGNYGAKKVGFGWNTSSDPCRDNWHGVTCNKANTTVRKVLLESIGVNGSFDSLSLCSVKSISVLSLQYNNVTREIPEDIGNCKSLTHLYLAGNGFSGKLPESLSTLRNLKRLHIEDNNFHGDLPNLVQISGLMSFLAANNHGLSGPIPSFDFLNFDHFNVSNNNFSGPIPDVKGKFGAESFLGNPYLCGEPLPNDCPQILNKEKPKKSSVKQLLIYSGYAAMGIVVLVFVVFKLLVKKKPREEKEEDKKKAKTAPEKSSTTVPSSTTSGESKVGKSEYSLTSMDSGVASSLVVLNSSVSLTFEELLRGSAELLGRGRNGSLYRVVVENGASLAVKRIRNWGISCDDFGSRMRRIHQVKHPNVMPLVAYYSSRQEKLLVYEFHQNGSLFKLLHESQRGQAFGWRSRLTVASTIAEALSFMHEELHEEGIAHGNLKSTNIMLNRKMEPYISEYGLMVVDNQDQSPMISPINSTRTEDCIELVQPFSTFKIDTYAFGVIVLELLTGRLVQKSGFDLTNWVQSVIREKWAAGVFDKALTSEGASEETMVKLLQVSLKCIDPSPNERPEMSQVSAMINAIKEEEEKSSVSFA